MAAIAGFDDLIAQAVPYLAKEYLEFVQGQTWKWGYIFRDNSGALVDMTSGFTATMAVRVENSAGNVVSVTVTFPSPGEVACAVAPAGTGVTPATYLHELTIVRSSDSAQIVAVGAGDSKLKVKPKVTI